MPRFHSRVAFAPTGIVACIILALSVTCGHADPPPPPATSPAKVVARLALVSDPHVSPEPRYEAYLKNFERVITDVNDANVDAVLLSGDLAQHGNPESFEKYN